MSALFDNARRLVVKVGSSLVTNDGRGLDHAAVARWAEEIAELRRGGREIVLVSSGAIAEGIARLGWTVRPKAIHELQAAATADHEAVTAALDASVRLAESAYRLGEITLDEALLAQREQLEARRELNDLRLSAALAALDVAYLAALPPLHEGDAR